MHLWRYWIVLGLLAVFAARAAVVYKWTDADGLVHFSDQPIPGAEKIATSGSATNGVSAGLPSAPARPEKKPSSDLNITELVIETPAKDQVFFGDDMVPVHLRITPELQPNQVLTWSLNGRPLADLGFNSTGFALPSMPRGSYTLSASVTDSVTGVSQAADDVTFIVRQPSELSPQHRKPGT